MIRRDTNNYQRRKKNVKKYKSVDKLKMEKRKSKKINNKNKLKENSLNYIETVYSKTYCIECGCIDIKCFCNDLYCKGCRKIIHNQNTHSYECNVYECITTGCTYGNFGLYKHCYIHNPQKLESLKITEKDNLKVLEEILLFPMCLKSIIANYFLNNKNTIKNFNEIMYLSKKKTYIAMLPIYMSYESKMEHTNTYYSMGCTCDLCENLTCDVCGSYIDDIDGYECRCRCEDNDYYFTSPIYFIGIGEY